MGFDPCPPFLFHGFRSQKTLQNVWYTAEEPSGDSLGKTDSNMRSMLECHRHVAISVFDLRAKSKIQASHFTEKSPRAKALRFLCLSRALYRRYRRLIKKILRLKLRDEGISFRGTTLIGMLFRLPPSQVHPTLSIVLSS